MRWEWEDTIFAFISYFTYANISQVHAIRQCNVNSKSCSYNITKPVVIFLYEIAGWLVIIEQNTKARLFLRLQFISFAS